MMLDKLGRNHKLCSERCGARSMAPARSPKRPQPTRCRNRLMRDSFAACLLRSVAIGDVSNIPLSRLARENMR
jgi:hypothetical protein